MSRFVKTSIPMKIKFLLIFAFLTTISYSQDLNTIQMMIKSTTTEQIRQLSDAIINSAPQKYIFYKIADSKLREEKYKVALYTLESVTDTDNTKLSETEKDNLIKVYWYDHDGVYTFKEVFGPEDMIKPFWQKTFATDYEYRVNKNLLYKLVKNERTYSIEKWY